MSAFMCFAPPMRIGVPILSTNLPECATPSRRIRGASGKDRAPSPDAGDQPERNHEVEEIPGEAVQERGLVRPKIVEYGTRHPATEGHAEQRHHEHDAK